MSLKCKRCDNEVESLDHIQSTLAQADDGTWGVDLILMCPYCAQAYRAFVPTADLTPHEDSDNED